ncbi:MAG: DUF1800 domain-containing protein [Proteobacteria bacterium]|nr:DUF1800 domain-containing protein [Pseudomonadota bacterium]
MDVVSEVSEQVSAPSTPPPSAGTSTRTATLLAVTAGALSACGGGGAGDPGQAPANRPAEPAGPVDKPASANEAARFLTQATLGYSRAELDALVRAGSYGDWLNAQFAQPRSQSCYDWLVAKGYDNAANINNTQGLDNAIWRKLIASPDALRQRVVLALSELCVVSVLGINASWRQFAVASYLDILDANAFGNYRQLLGQISLSPAMGYYLTFRGNVKANPAKGSEPDENYARELMQLFTIGLVQLGPDGSVQSNGGKPVETYKQADVSGLARVFTGWDLDTAGLASPYPPEVMRRPMAQVASRYESGSKTFLGVTVAAGASASDSLKTALDTLFNHPNLPVFVGRQMIQRLVTSNPSPAYVARVAAAFANNGAGVRGDMQALLKAILLDPEARDARLAATPSYGKLREPVVRFLNWARAYGATSASDAWAIGDLSDPATRLGQSPMRSPSVFNFFRPGYVPPNTTLSDQGLTAPELQITNEVSVAGYVNYMQQVIGNSLKGDLRADYATLMPLAGNSAALLAEINQVLAAGALSAATLGQIQAAVDSVAPTAANAQQNRIFIALTLVMASPEFIAQK